MREILFIGKRKDNGEWVEGFYHYTNWINPITKELVKTTYSILPIGGQDAYEVIPETVGQFTGLPDKKGKKIFTGHVVKVDGFMCTVNGLYQVIYDEINHCYALERDADYHHHYFTYSELNGFHETSEVIGNIHDNPELLKGGAE